VTHIHIGFVRDYYLYHSNHYVDLMYCECHTKTSLQLEGARLRAVTVHTMIEWQTHGVLLL